MQRLRPRTRRQVEEPLPSISPARQAAFDVLQMAEQGAFASDTLRSRTAALSHRDAGLAGQIVFGVLRRRGQLDRAIESFSKRKAEKLDSAVLNILRMALFQVYFLDRVPVWAAVHEAVEMTKQHRRAASGLVNAILRRATESSMPSNAMADPSCPPWLLERWRHHFGTEVAAGIAMAALEEAPVFVRLPENGPSPSPLNLVPTEVSGAFLVPSTEEAGSYPRQDLGAQAIVPLLELQPGMTALDLCSAPGNKTRQMLESRPGFLVASDVSRRRLATIPDGLNRVLLDGTAPLPFTPRTFDRILVDAPCSGTGTLAHNPEIKWRLHLDDLPVFAARQCLLVKHALTVLRPGGRLVFSTCSLECEENEEVTKRILEQHPEIRLAREQYRIPGREAGDGFYAAAFDMLP